MTKPPTSKPATHPTSPAGHPSGSSSAGTTNTAALKSVPIVVLNNTETTGLAKSAAQTFEAGGWTVTNYSNYTNDIVSTCAYYDPANPQAKAAAEALQAQFPAIKRVKEQFSGLSQYDSPIVVILTPDYSSD